MTTNSSTQAQAPNWGHILAAIFLVAGTCIGGGMLALPVATGVNGLMPSLLIMLGCWIAMTVTGLLLVEVSLWFEEGAHFSTMATTLLGTFGRVVTWILYLFIGYASIVGYTAAGGSQVAEAVRVYLGLAITKELGAFLFLIIFSGVIFLGSELVGRVNTILFFAMILAYLGLIGSGVPYVKPALLAYENWNKAYLAIPLLLTSFSFQTMAPSLTPYLKRNIRALRIAVVAGTTICVVVYAVWQLLILGIVPAEGPNSLATALQQGEPPTLFLRHHLNNHWICAIAEFFAFFALATSFLGIGLGLFDFLADGLALPKRGYNKVVLIGLLAVPTYLVAVFFERIFIIAMEASGGFGDAILSGMIPVIMVWMGRYYYKEKAEWRLFGGKWLLSIIFLFFLAVLLLEIGLYSGLV